MVLATCRPICTKPQFWGPSAAGPPVWALCPEHPRPTARAVGNMVAKSSCFFSSRMLGTRLGGREAFKNSCRVFS
jgi:hypothetical protein